MRIFPTRILLATDGSEEAQLAAQTAVEIAQKTGSELHVLTVGREYPMYVLPEYGENFEEVLERNEQRIQEILDKQVKKIEEAGGKVAKTHLKISNRPEREIVRLGEEIDCGLIIIGSRGLGGIKRALMGSVSDSVVHHAHCPVLVVRKEKPEETAGFEGVGLI